MLKLDKLLVDLLLWHDHFIYPLKLQDLTSSIILMYQTVIRDAEEVCHDAVLLFAGTSNHGSSQSFTVKECGLPSFSVTPFFPCFNFGIASPFAPTTLSLLSLSAGNSAFSFSPHMELWELAMGSPDECFKSNCTDS